MPFTGDVMTSITKRGTVLGLVATLALGATACDNDSLTDANRNPNNPTTAPAGPVFTQGVRLAASRWMGAGYDMRGTSLVAQHLAEVQYPESDQYRRLQGTTTTDFFDGAYANELKDFKEVVEAGRELAEPGIWGPAQTMMVWSFAHLTDTYGDIPYFQALAGDSAEAIIQPAYDAQKDIYTDFFAKLDEVSKALAAAPSGSRTMGAADPIYGGNFTRWQRLANSIRARQAMRLVNVDPTTARAQFLAAVGAPGGLLASNADNARIVWPGGVNANSNPWSVNLQTRDDFRISDDLMIQLRDNQDPRVAVYAQRAEVNSDSPFIVKYCPDATTPCYAGLQNALQHAQASPLVPATSRPGIIFFPASTTYGPRGGLGPTTPSYIFTYAEAAFLMAEAVERGWVTGSAATWYADGIRASMAQWGVTDAAAITAFLARPSVAYQGGAAGLAQIARQKWVALFTQGGQAWAEWRRTCQPATIEPGPEAIVNEVPRRFQYSVTEATTNETNLAAAVARQGADNLLTRMYWDKAPQAAPTYTAGCGVR